MGKIWKEKILFLMYPIAASQKMLSFFVYHFFSLRLSVFCISPPLGKKKLPHRLA